MRSKSLLVSNILATFWTGFILFSVISFFAKGGAAYFVWANYTNVFLADLFRSSEDVLIFATLLNVVYILAAVHTFLFTLATIFAWIGYGSKGSGFALSAAILYLIGTLICPIFILSCLPIIILGFVGQCFKIKLNRKNKKAETLE